MYEEARRAAFSGALFLDERALMDPGGVVPHGWWTKIDAPTLRSHLLTESVLGRLGALVPGGLSYLGVARELGLDHFTEGKLGFSPHAAHIRSAVLDWAWREVIADRRQTTRLLIPAQGR